MCITEYDEARTFAEQREEGREEGRAEGRTEGRAEGRAELLDALVQRYRERGMSEAEITDLLSLEE